MNRVIAAIRNEVREVLPATVFFFLLFHMIALTKAVVLSDYNITALRAVDATVASLLVAKAIVVVGALPMSRLFSGKLVWHVLWKTLLYTIVVLLFRIVEEAVPLVLKYKSLSVGVKAMYGEVSWPLFGVLSLWIVGGLVLYCLASELTKALGSEKIKSVLLEPAGGDSRK